MRLLIAFVCVGLMGTAALAQVTGTLNPPRPPVVTAPAAPVERVSNLFAPISTESNFFYADAELLLLWFKPVCASIPVVAIGNPSDAVPGAIGQPGTKVVVGGQPPHKFEFPLTPGWQVTFGWGRGDGRIGFEFSGFIMAQASNSQTFNADSNGFPYTYLPYTAPDNSFQALPFTIPGVVTGGSVAVGSTKLWGTSSTLTLPFSIDRGDFALYGTMQVGARYLDLTDQVNVTNSLRLVANPAAVAVGMAHFETHNQFAGPQLGMTMGVTRGRFAVELTTRLAAGVTRQTRIIEGAPLIDASLILPLLVPGPLLALPSDIGRSSTTRATLVPEIAVKTRFGITDWCSVTLGYSLLYWNKVICPGDQMSPFVNVTQLPFRGPVTGPLDPHSPFVHTDYFAQGMSFGIEFRY